MKEEKSELILQVVSRYGSHRNIEKISENKYIIYGESMYTRSSNHEGVLTFMDYEGGPAFSVDDNIREMFGPKLPDKKIVSLERYPDKINGVLIILEE
jgi:hypothetical protein